MNRYAFLYFIFCFVFPVLGKDIKIGVYRDQSISRIDFAYYQEPYQIVGDGKNFGTLNPNEFVSVIQSGNKVMLKKGVVQVGTFQTVELIPTTEENSIRLRPRMPILKERRYKDKFSITIGNRGLTIVNNVSFRHYLGGVIESEGGGGKHIEYYKAQAVISRTYALRHFNRHQKEGFNLCDQVHCQAYFNQLIYTDDIQKAVDATDGIYMMDSVSNQLIEGYFHANCGGETSSSDYVWREDIAYLQPVKDTFCIYTRQAKWTKKISKSEWRNFLVNQYFYPVEDTLWKERMYYFEQPYRKAFYIHPSLGIPLRDIRYRFNLKSTFFSCRPDGNYVLLEGRGFGHGVGLCQEGAMNMAKSGMTYREILRYYFQQLEFHTFFEEMFFNQKIPNAGEI